MTEERLAGAASVTMEDLIALNAEITSLVRAGIPLELGLGTFASSLDGRLGKLAARLSQRMQQGLSLDQALEADGDQCPEMYRAVVRTGLKSGRLPEALESLTGFAQSILELRQRVGLAFLYPFIVFFLAYGLFVFMMTTVLPRALYAYRDMQLIPTPGVTRMLAIGESAVYWGPGIPLVILLIILGWSASERRMLSASRAPRTALGRGFARVASFKWLPGIYGILANFHRAVFAELLAILIQHRIPLHESLRLAAESTGDARIVGEAHRLALGIEQGGTLSDGLKASQVFPPFMRWLLTAGEQQGALIPALQQINTIYRRRALHTTEWFKLFLPIAVVVILGGGATLVYALALFYPLAEMLRALNVG